MLPLGSKVYWPTHFRLVLHFSPSLACFLVSLLIHDIVTCMSVFELATWTFTLYMYFYPLNFYIWLWKMWWSACHECRKGRTYPTLSGHSVTVLATARGQYTNYTGCMSNKNLVYGLALCESSEYNPFPKVRKSHVWILAGTFVQCLWHVHMFHIHFNTKPKSEKFT